MAKKKTQIETAIETLLAQRKELEWKFKSDVAGIDAAIKVLETQAKKRPKVAKLAEALPAEKSA